MYQKSAPLSLYLAKLYIFTPNLIFFFLKKLHYVTFGENWQDGFARQSLSDAAFATWIGYVIMRGGYG